jgi:ferredoxin-NADP reductase
VTTDAPAAAPTRWHEVVIDHIEHQTPRVVSLFLRPPFDAQLAGQHLDVRLTAPDGYQAERSYSIASAPGSDLIELAIERLDDGEVSPFFYDVAQPGDTIEIRGPIGGHFVWQAADGGPVLLVGGGSGVAPLVSMVRYRAAAAPDTPMALVYSSRTWADVIFREELLTRERIEPHLLFVAITTRGPRARETDFERRLDQMIARQVLDRWGQLPRLTFVCGANLFVDAVTAALITQGIPAAQIRTERYGGP